MTNLEQMLERNQEYANTQHNAGTLMPSLSSIIPGLKAIIIGCADMRVDPEALLGIRLGEALILRNIGGRVTPGLIEQIKMLGRIGEIVRQAPGGGGEFHLIVLHHTDCGMQHLMGETTMLSHFFQMPEEELQTMAVNDPRAAVTVDVAALRAAPWLPAKWVLSGLVYDVATGLVTVVVPPAPIRT